MRLKGGGENEYVRHRKTWKIEEIVKVRQDQPSRFFQSGNSRLAIVRLPRVTKKRWSFQSCTLVHLSRIFRINLARFRVGSLNILSAYFRDARHPWTCPAFSAALGLSGLLHFAKATASFHACIAQRFPPNLLPSFLPWIFNYKARYNSSSATSVVCSFFYPWITLSKFIR